MKGKRAVSTWVMPAVLYGRETRSNSKESAEWGRLTTIAEQDVWT
jgi:hypothetical protein